MVDVTLLLLCLLAATIPMVYLLARQHRWMAARGGSTVPRELQHLSIPNAASLAATIHMVDEAATHHLVLDTLSERAVLHTDGIDAPQGSIGIPALSTNSQLRYTLDAADRGYRIEQVSASSAAYSHDVIDDASGEAVGHITLHPNLSFVFSRHAQDPSWATLTLQGASYIALLLEAPESILTKRPLLRMLDDEGEPVFDAVMAGGLSRDVRIATWGDTSEALLLCGYALLRGLGRRRPV